MRRRGEKEGELRRGEDEKRKSKDRKINGKGKKLCKFLEEYGWYTSKC